MAGLENSKRHMDGEEWFMATLSSIGDAVIATDVDGSIQFMNPAAELLTGWKREEVGGRPIAEVFNLIRMTDQGEEKTADSLIKQAMRSGSVLRIDHQVELVTRNGTRIAIEESIAPIRDRHDRVIGSVLVFKDITERKEAEEQLRYLSLHDGLTGLYNRAYFTEEMRRLGGQRGPVGIIVCDVDGLKLVNDVLGHDAGDSLLQVTAGVIRSCFRKGDVVARIGGDEFAVLLSGSDGATTEKAACRIRCAVASYNVSNPSPGLSLSVGFAASGRQPVDMTELFKDADNSMYQEKMYNRQLARSQIFHKFARSLAVEDLKARVHA